MSSISEETDPSERNAAARNSAAGPVPNRVTFNRVELNRILNLYGRMVAEGEWRDYAIDFLKDRAVFSVFRRASEVRSIASKKIRGWRASRASTASSPPPA